MRKLLVLLILLPLLGLSEVPPIVKSSHALTMDDGQCSAVAVRRDAYLTVAHCKPASGDIWLDENAKVEIEKEDQDLILLRTRSWNRFAPATPIKLAKRDAKEGERVFIAGFPGHPKYVFVSEGFMSGEWLDGVMVGSYRSFPGMSGSPITNTKGELVGVHIGVIEAYPFAMVSVPLRTVRAFMEGVK